MTRLGLVIGNSRLHWGYFQGGVLSQRWDTPHLCHDLSALPPDLRAYLSALSLYGASVVPSQTALIDKLTTVAWLTLESIPLKNLYPTLGIDRALGLLGAGAKYGFPCLVIDGGTALTFTGVDRGRSLVGGAILPGLRLQLLSLSQQTATLPEITLPPILPPRWAKTTDEAISGGILYTVLSGIFDFIWDWWRRFPDSPVILTGGDGTVLSGFLKNQYPELGERIHLDLDLVLVGMGICSF
jgi:type III pantothenate kinase